MRPRSSGTAEVRDGQKISTRIKACVANQLYYEINYSSICVQLVHDRKYLCTAGTRRRHTSRRHMASISCVQFYLLVGPPRSVIQSLARGWGHTAIDLSYLPLWGHTAFAAKYPFDTISIYNRTHSMHVRTDRAAALIERIRILS